MRVFLLHTGLALTWVILTGSFTRDNFLFGAVIGYLILLMFRSTLGATSYFKKVRQIFDFVVYFAWQLLISNLRVAYEVLTPGMRMCPGIVAIPLDIQRDIEITLLANLITLTPGTLSLEVAEDKSVLYVHSMYVDDRDEFITSIKDGFEKRVQELFQ